MFDEFFDAIFFRHIYYRKLSFDVFYYLRASYSLENVVAICSKVSKSEVVKYEPSKSEVANLHWHNSSHQIHKSFLLVLHKHKTHRVLTFIHMNSNNSEVANQRSHQVWIFYWVSWPLLSEDFSWCTYFSCRSDH